METKYIHQLRRSTIYHTALLYAFLHEYLHCVFDVMIESDVIDHDNVRTDSATHILLPSFFSAITITIEFRPTSIRDVGKQRQTTYTQTQLPYGTCHTVCSVFDEEKYYSSSTP